MSKRLTLSQKVLFELPTENESFYQIAEIPFLPRVDDEVYFDWPKDCYFDLEVESVRYQFNWGWIVVRLSEIKVEEDPAVIKALASGGWTLYDDLQ